MAPPGAGTAPMVGRDAELAALCAAVGLDGGTPGHLLLSGDAGVGKSRLLRAVRERAMAAGWRVLAGHCLDLDASAAPYLPVTEVLGRAVAELPQVVDDVRRRHPVLERLMPGHRTVATDETGEGGASRPLDRVDLFDAVHALLLALAEQAPLLVVVEDLHWADRSTLDLLGSLLRRELGPAVAVVGSYRSDDLHRRHPLRRELAEWARLRTVDRLALAPLAEDATRALVAALATELLDPDVVTGIVDRAEGNPFFVEELVASSGAPALATDLADLLLVRLDRLDDDDARRVVGVAAVAGRRVRHELLELVAGLSGPALQEALRAGVGSNVLLAAEDGYSFRHALLAEAVYDDLLPGERVRLHAAYAGALAERPDLGSPAERARHARRSLDPDAAVLAGIEAGAEAARVGGAEEAAQHYEQVLELLVEPGRAERLEVEVSLLVVRTGDALLSAGHAQRAAAVLREQLARLAPVTDQPSATRRSRLLTAYAMALLSIEPDEDVRLVAAEAVRLAPPGESPLRARALANHAYALWAYGDDEQAREVALEGLALAEQLRSAALVPELLTTLGMIGSRDAAQRRELPGVDPPGKPGEGGDERRDDLHWSLEDAVEAARGAGVLPAELRARYLLGRVHEDAGEYARAATWFRGAVERATEAGTPLAPFGLDARWQLAWTCWATGEWDEAERLTEVPGAPPVPAAMLAGVGLVVAHERGRDVEGAVAASRHLWTEEGGIAVFASSVLLDAAGRRQDPRAVVAAHDDVVGVLSRLWSPDFAARVRLATTALAALARCVPAVAGADRPELLREAAWIHDEGRRVAAVRAEPGRAWGPEGRAWALRLEAEARRLRWLLGPDPAHGDPDGDPDGDQDGDPGRDTDRAALVGAWREAEEATVAAGVLPEVLRVRVTLAGLLRSTGDATGAREVGDLARAAAHAMGARRMLEDLVASGSTPRRRRAAEGSVALTARETEVLALVAEGLSNGQIARRLFISTKTVSVHVSNVLGKLGASGRTQAVTLARRQSLIG